MGNCVVNGILLKEKIFENLWIQPAAGDAGGSLGAALAFWHHELKMPRLDYKDQMQGSYLGPKFENDAIKSALDEKGAKYHFYQSEDELLEKVVHGMTNEKVVGWFQGRMEFGPRALGGRSILADPRSANMQKNLNLKIKYKAKLLVIYFMLKLEHLNKSLQTD